MTDPVPGSSARAGTVLGAVSAPARGAVDERGLVTPGIDAGWALDWWIGAEDRWHLPQVEASVRQRLVDDVPVVETAMRVPGGDVLHRAYVVHDRVDEVVVEIENRTAVPVALALVVRRTGATASAPGPQVRIDGAALLVGDEVGVRLPSSPNASVLCPPGAEPAAAVVFPLAHTAVLRVALPLVDEARPDGASTPPTGLPPAARVAAGWAAQLRQGTRLELPGESLAALVQASRAFLLLAHGGDHLVGAAPGDETVAVLRALDEWGFHRQAAQVLAAGADVPATGATLVALVRHWQLSRDRELVDLLSTSLAAGVSRLGRGGRRRTGDAVEEARWRVRGLRAAAEVLADTGQPDAAAKVARRAEELAVVSPPMSKIAPATDEWRSSLDDLVRETDLAVIRHHPPTGAAFLGAFRSLLVREVDGAAPGDRRLALCSLWPSEWRGQSLEVHGAPTTHGRLSYAVRWHGERPALLWELEPHDEGTDDDAAVGAVTLLAPGLDTTWASRDPRGEALLAVPRVDGSESSGGSRPEEGASFS